MSYQRLREHFGRIGQLSEIEAIVEWDQAVNMPEGAGSSRAEAMAGLARVKHELLRDLRIDEWLNAAERENGLGEWEKANLREMSHAHRRAVGVPSDLVEASTRADKESEQAWRRFRAENDFAAYAPYLEQVVAFKRRVAEARSEVLDLSLYDALIDEFEPGIRSSLLDAAFAPLEDFLPAFTDQVIEQQRGRRLVVPEGPFPADQQTELGLRMMQAVGFDFDGGRLDVSHHPFCGGVPQDVRITTRFEEGNFLSSLMAILHESGHGKYEQGLPRAWNHQPIGAARGMALHESQSLLLEMQVCRGDAFLAFAAPYVREAFPESAAIQPDAYTPENLVALCTRVERSLIRVDADEVTYPAHILLRYGLERRLIEGSLRTHDLPEAWDDGMQQLLHLTTAGNDRDGCMQDVHWPMGAFGYFPLYTLGALVAAQLFASAERTMPDLLSEVRQGSFLSLNRWLGEHVWRWGSRYSTDELVRRATGEPIDARYFIEHLQKRYLPG